MSFQFLAVANKGCREPLGGRQPAPLREVEIRSALKRLYGKAGTRCHSVERNAADFFAFAAIYNLRRAVILGAG